MLNLTRTQSTYCGANAIHFRVSLVRNNLYVLDLVLCFRLFYISFRLAFQIFRGSYFTTAVLK